MSEKNISRGWLKIVHNNIWNLKNEISHQHEQNTIRKAYTIPLIFLCTNRVWFRLAYSFILNSNIQSARQGTKLYAFFCDISDIRDKKRLCFIYKCSKACILPCVPKKFIPLNITKDIFVHFTTLHLRILKLTWSLIKLIHYKINTEDQSRMIHFDILSSKMTDFKQYRSSPACQLTKDSLRGSNHILFLCQTRFQTWAVERVDQWDI